MKLIYPLIFLLLFSASSVAQIEPGLLLGLTNATSVEMNAVTTAATGSLLYNSTDGGLYVFNGSSWVQVDSGGTDDQTLEEVLAMGTSAGNNNISDLADPAAAQDASTKNYVDNLSRVYVGAFRITSAGTQDISGLPFAPSSITFTAHANVEDYNINSDNGTRNNERGLPNSYGSMNGFARNDGGSIANQVIYVGGHGNSINDISRYASDSHCIGIRYGNQNGDSLGLTTASISSFNSDGFTVDTDNYADGLLVLYTAYR